MKKLFFVIFILLLSGCSGSAPNGSGGGNVNTALYGKDLTEDMISVDEETGITYVNDQLLITFEQGTSRQTAENIISSVNGVIVGEIGFIDKYQVELEGKYTLEQLTNAAVNLKSKSSVLDVGVNYVIDAPNSSYTPNDKEWKDEWDSSTNKKTWHIQAVRAQGAWDYMDKMQTVNVGVIEAVSFSTDSDDINFAANVFNNSSTSETHGLSVCSIIASSFNDEGICGIMPNAKLYASVVNGKTSNYPNEVLDLFNYETHFAYMICSCRCKVINLSVGWDEQELEAQVDTDCSDDISRVNSELTFFFKELLARDYDFLIVKSAGNINDDFITEYGGDNVDLNKCIISGITDVDVRSHIIVVGANTLLKSVGAEKNVARYNIALFSSGGMDFSISALGSYNGQVDVTAPGVDVWAEKSKNKYGGVYGTSFSAPIVSGIAGMVYGINPELNGAQVKHIICKTSYGEIRMADAKAAVELALNYDPNASANEFTTRDALGVDNLPNYYNAQENVQQNTVDDEDEIMDEINDLIDEYEVTANSEDFKTLENELNKKWNIFCWLGYDSETDPDSSLAYKIMYTCDLEPVNSDPLFNENFYCRVPADKVDFIAKSKFNKTIDHDKVKAFTDDGNVNEWHDYCYYYDGYYYAGFEWGPGPYGFYNWKKESAQLQSDGTYRIHLKGEPYEMTIGKPELTPYDLDVIAGIENVEGGKLWKFYYISGEAYPSDSESEVSLYGASVPEDAHEWKGHYYACFDNCKTWSEAETYCESLGGHLAVITSAAEDNELYGYIKSLGYDSAYFGLTDSAEEGAWIWINGEKSSYSNWHYGEPNSYNSTEDYAMYSSKYTDGTWNDGDFGETSDNSGRVFICEWG